MDSKKIWLFRLYIHLRGFSVNTNNSITKTQKYAYECLIPPPPTHTHSHTNTVFVCMLYFPSFDKFYREYVLY